MPAATPVIKKMRQMVMDGAAYAAVASWLNDEGVQPGPYATKAKWTGRLVEDLLRDPILHGTRTYADITSQATFRDGNASENEIHRVLKLDIIPSWLTCRSRNMMSCSRLWTLGHNSFVTSKAPSILSSPSPGPEQSGQPQHPRCTICGELLYRYNYDKLKCQRSLRASGDTPCWNHVQVSCAEIRNRVLSWVINHCQQVDGFRDVMIEAAWTEIQRIRHQDARKQQSIDEEVAELKRRSSNLAQAIAKGGHLDAPCSSLPRSRQT